MAKLFKNPQTESISVIEMSVIEMSAVESLLCLSALTPESNRKCDKRKQTVFEFNPKSFEDSVVDRPVKKKTPQAEVPEKQTTKCPSGTACEKHRAWKRLCPEDCPNRKNRKPMLQKGKTSIVYLTLKPKSLVQ